MTSIRSGLRKRKRAESPQPTEPQISEEWVEEDKLELWEIKLIGEKIEKSKLAATTRSVTQQRQNESSSPNMNSTSNSLNKSLGSARGSSDDGKEKNEQQLKVQRLSTNQQKRTSDINRPSVQG